MVHNAEAESPRIFVQNEHDTDYSDPIVPETAIVDAIRERTDEHLKALGNATVSSKPIVLRAEYAYCANITIIDTPVRTCRFTFGFFRVRFKPDSFLFL